MSEKKKHRGRIQAQGDGLEASENWAQNEPLTAQDGLELLEKLKQKIRDQDAKTREKEFKKNATILYPDFLEDTTSYQAATDFTQ